MENTEVDELNEKAQISDRNIFEGPRDIMIINSNYTDNYIYTELEPVRARFPYVSGHVQEIQSCIFHIILGNGCGGCP